MDILESTRFLCHLQYTAKITFLHFKGDAGPSSATPVSRPISNATSYYRGNPNIPDGGSPYVNGNQTPSGASPTKSRVMRFGLISQLDKKSKSLTTKQIYLRIRL